MSASRTSPESPAPSTGQRLARGGARCRCGIHAPIPALPAPRDMCSSEQPAPSRRRWERSGPAREERAGTGAPQRSGAAPSQLRGSPQAAPALRRRLPPSSRLLPAALHSPRSRPSSLSSLLHLPPAAPGPPTWSPLSALRDSGSLTAASRRLQPCLSLVSVCLSAYLCCSISVSLSL